MKKEKRRISKSTKEVLGATIFASFVTIVCFLYLRTLPYENILQRAFRGIVLTLGCLGITTALTLFGHFIVMAKQGGQRQRNRKRR